MLKQSLFFVLIVGVLVGLVVGYYLPHESVSTVEDDVVPPLNGHYDRKKWAF